MSLFEQLNALSDEGSDASEPDAVPEGFSYITGLRATVAEVLGEALDSAAGGGLARPPVQGGAAIYQEMEEELEGEEAVDDEASISGAEEDDDPDAHRKARPALSPTDADYLHQTAPLPDAHADAPNLDTDVACPDPDAAYPDTDARYPDEGEALPDTGEVYPDSDPVRRTQSYTGIPYAGDGDRYPDRGNVYSRGGVPQPNLDAGYPNTDAAYPNTDAAYPNTDAAYPNTDAAYPNTDAAYPNTDAAYPNTDAAYPNTDAAHPDAEASFPCRGATYPARDGAYPSGGAGYSGADGACHHGQSAAAVDRSQAPNTVVPVGTTRDAVAAASARWSTSGSAVSLPRPAPAPLASSKPVSPARLSPVRRAPGPSQFAARPPVATAAADPPPAPPAATHAPPPPTRSPSYAARAAPPATTHALPATDAPAGAPAAPPPAAPSRPRWRPPEWVKPAVLHQPVLEMIERGTVRRSMPVGSRGVWVLGRHGGVADIQLDDPSISRAQAAILNSSSATFLADLDSAHGTWYDPDGRNLSVPQLGQRLGAEPVQLQEGATFRLGCSKAVYRVRGVQAERLERWAPPPWAEPPQRKCFLQVRSNDFSNPYLVHLQDEDGDGEEELPLVGRCTILGRKADLCDVVLTDSSVSRQHAVVLHAEAGGRPESFVHDLGSASGTFVNAQRIAPGKPFRLADGDAISLGESKATYTFRVGTAGARRPAGGRDGGPKKRARAC
eukprot:scaffold1116_cov103-Isochrysis_galbana.AAC.10